MKNQCFLLPLYILQDVSPVTENFNCFINKRSLFLLYKITQISKVTTYRDKIDEPIDKLE